jgi:hypothetical protein
VARRPPRDWQPRIWSASFGEASKIFHITEGISLTLRADAINLLNKPQWGSQASTSPNIDTNINSASFGRITSATENRTITFNARIDF